ncbi:2,3-bisphosphoglycerate-independent phosphoglycerate mutase [Peijinzhouia sedimentorum]
MNRKVLLMILDGWGIASNKSVSAIDAANTPFIDGLYEKYPHSKLQASGLFVGLPDGQMGNSEVGHMNIGAGRIVYQDLVKINKSIQEGEIRSNAVLMDALHEAKKPGRALHLMGLLSDGGVHSHIDHLIGLCKIAVENQIDQIFIHAFTDGRDTDPKSGLRYIQELEQAIEGTQVKIASVVGRYYAMDRDKRWERVKIAYNALCLSNPPKEEAVLNLQQAIQEQYNKGVTDEFLPALIPVDIKGNRVGNIKENDIVICFNFRTDRGREITEVLTQKDFPEYGMKTLPLHYVTLTQYDHSFRNVHAIFTKDDLKNTLGEVVSKAGRKQIRIAETEKYPHVTFFFSGGREVPFEGEERIMCPSPKVATYDLKPEMSAMDIRDAIIPKLEREETDFICLNFANPDMVGHTGVFEAAVKACEVVDSCAQSVTETALEHNYTVVIIADHGNSDMMINPDGSPNTAHTTNPVPCILLDREFNGKLNDGKLGDLAPTILTLMGIEIPTEMTGTCLI